MKQIFLRRIFFAVSIIALCFISCKVSKRQTNNPPNPGTSCTATTTLEFSDSNCTTTGGCTLTFSCPSLTESGFQKFVGMVADKFNLPFHDLTSDNTPLVISSITTVDTPALLQTAPGLVPQNWYSNATGAVTIDCTNDKGQISCPLFAPVGSQFNIVGTFGGSDVTVQVTVTNGITPATNASDLTTGCGQFGTTYQRIFDCSERVTNFAGAGTYGNPSTFQTNPDANWYLVACPVFTGTTVGTDTTVQQCAWLSPVVTPVTLPSAGVNPVVDINQNSGAAPTTDPTSPDFVAGVTRILWSGSLNNSDTSYYDSFGVIVGTDNTSTASGGPYANCYNASGTGKCANYDNGDGSSSPYTYDDMISVNDSATTTLGLANICAIQLLTNDNAFSGMSTTPYSWQVPSYPMIMTLTGGSACTYVTGTTGNCNAAGFSAISSTVPAFESSTNYSSYLWSSSLNGTDYAWQFYGYDGFGYVKNSDLSSFPRAVRCASIAW